MDFRCGTSTSFRTVTKPHMKNSVVTTDSATLLLEAGEPTAPAEVCMFAIAMGFSSRLPVAGNIWRRIARFCQHHNIAGATAALDCRLSITCAEKCLSGSVLGQNNFRGGYGLPLVSLSVIR